MRKNGIPTLWQNIIFRNYGVVSTGKIAQVLKTTENVVVENAALLGLQGITFCKEWTKKGFVTIIRNNYDLLPDEEIVALLDLTQAEFEKLLVEFDFLNVKLGVKQEIGDYRYTPLNVEQKKQTREIGKKIRKLLLTPQVKPFDFFADTPLPQTLNPGEFSIADRFTSAYCGNYGDTLNDDDLSDYTEEYLRRVSAAGVNGLWIHETLRNLSPFPFDERYNGDYKRRVANLRTLTERCAEYGINIYLYLNEPRSLPEEFFVKFPNLRGQKTEDGYCLCTSLSEVQKYLYDSVKSIAKSVPLLKGVMTITMSENATHCYSRYWAGVEPGKTECAHCRNRTAVEVAAEVNNIMCRALKDGNGYTKLIANIWAWADSMGWTEEMTLRGIELLDKDVEVLCVSEFSKTFERGGVQGQVIDYSISVVGPSEITVKSLKKAKETGHKIWAKIQVNNSWECAGVPYVPAFDLMIRHVDNVKQLGVTGLMMGWSLGGYPGGALPLCNIACTEGKFEEMQWYTATYQENAQAARKAVKIFSEAYEEFPFSISSIYCGGQHLACGNMWSLEPDNRNSTMVCFAFDDGCWAYPYGLDGYIRQLTLLTKKWEEGQKIIEHYSGNLAFEELKRVAEGVFLQMSAAKNMAEFVKYKNSIAENKMKVIEIIEEERNTTKRLYALLCRDAKIGYEISNHYFYNANLLLEKFLNLDYIEQAVRNT